MGRVAWNKGLREGKKHTLPCSVVGCTNPYCSKDLCKSHYGQLQRGVPVLDMVPFKPRRARGTGGLNEGYIRVRVGKGVKGQHRLVMEEILGRELLEGENVHHINGVRDDNRKENLELWITSQPKGQRPADLVEWAEEILRLYKGEKECS